MITIISSTNRKNSGCLQFSRHFFRLFQDRVGKEVKLLSLEDLPQNIMHPDMYENGGQSPEMAAIQNEFMIPSEKFFFVVPEYNGGFPGVLKLFLDACSVREYNRTFKGKKAALVGVATGRAGNLRGMEHLTGVLNYVGTIVMPSKLPISGIENLTNGNGGITDREPLEVMKKQVEDFLEF